MQKNGNWFLMLISVIGMYMVRVSSITQDFFLNQNEIRKVDNLMHLGLPIGNQTHVEEFFCEKFRKVERSLYSLYSLGCNNNGLNFHTIANIYKTFCQSIFYYGLETNFIRKQCLNKINVRENTLLKNIMD